MPNILVIVSLLIFYTLFIGRTLLLSNTGIKVIVLGKDSNKLTSLLEKLTFPFLILWTILILLISLNVQIPIIFDTILKNSYLEYIGIILCYIGLVIFLIALISFGNSWRVGIDSDNQGKLVKNGIFKYSRNPIFLFMDMYFIGITLIYPTTLFIIMTLIFIIGVHKQILNEEKHLLAIYKEDYKNYKKETRRYL
ncbi:isoprenylcysteine carboxylmethyltransferase family protein [Methanobrevibacter sp. TMH8]|uniref:methyltransferase family protein n=1 Tax=Methanobrevibacter sp. TMH8 TaxID=2848611 RepID=UPI001CCD90A1|nr:isoprenylcysteine carboxylmethyltransferase family protein [Methanobrevibacter sp. TMH8]MBZ9570976.1 isoprenylcysteine carboxylmethyltransferase family protein [Methanobrevibacter sp. TMH8]